MKNRTDSFSLYWSAAKKYFSILFISWLFLSPSKVFAEGSKELSANGGYRAFLVSSNFPNLSFPFPTLGTMKVYAKAGESIYLGSSAQGLGSGTIILRSPDGTVYTSGNSASIGRIDNRGQELAGPLPNSGGYAPFIRTVGTGQEGVWEIDFLPQSGGSGTGSNPVPIPANANWVQATGTTISYIAAFDVSVRNTGNTSFIPGRLYTNIFSGFLGTFDVGFNGIFRILTKDGYQYTLDNNGQAGNGFSFFANNKGFRDNSGAASYKSVDDLTNPNIQDPRIVDSPSDVTHKIFFNTPAADLPAIANVPGGSSTWLLTVPVTPSVSNSSFTGVEGSVGKAGTNPLGGFIGFDANKNGNYLISIDVNNNGIFTDAIDRKLTGSASGGPNRVYWDGIDGQGNKAQPAVGQIAVNISIVLFGGEVHFPFFDVERNVNGIVLNRTNGNGAPDNTLYWDDSPITIIVGTPSNPLTNLTGINSTVNGHIWGTSGAGPVDFGDENGIDTWAYISSTPLISTVTLQLQEADLEILSINSTQDCITKNITYNVSVRNNGPAPVTGAKFRFTVPVEINALSVSSTQTLGTSAVSSGAVSVSGYDAVIDMNSGSVRTFLISGNVPTAASGILLNVVASILRPADVTDSDSTNPDSAPPSDPVSECNSAPSGTGCNNVKLYTIANLSVCIVPPDPVIPNVFTPNGDGKNDLFEIAGLDKFPGSGVIVFNRWGNEVYRSSNYLNTWNGSGLADGTYFYVLNRRESWGAITVVKGWVYLKR